MNPTRTAALAFGQSMDRYVQPRSSGDAQNRQTDGENINNNTENTRTDIDFVCPNVCPNVSNFYTDDSSASSSPQTVATNQRIFLFPHIPSRIAFDTVIDPTELGALTVGNVVMFDDCSVTQFKLRVPQDEDIQTYACFYTTDTIVLPKPGETVDVQGGQFSAFGFPRMQGPAATLESYFAAALRAVGGLAAINLGAAVTMLPGARAGAALECRCALRGDRADMAVLLREAAHFQPYSPQYAAYKHAFLAKFYATVGRTLWSYLPAHDRQAFMSILVQIWHLTQYPLQAKQSIYADINQLQQNGGRVDLELTADDLNSTAYYQDQQARYVVHQTNKALHKYLLKVTVRVGDQSDNELLTGAHALLQLKVGYWNKIELLAKAMVVWPEEIFVSDSEAVMEFIAENHQYLRGLRARNE